MGRIPRWLSKAIVVTMGSRRLFLVSGLGLAMFLVGWFATTLPEITACQLIIRPMPGQDRNEYRFSIGGRLIQHASRAPDDWRIEVPAAMTAMRSDWHLRVVFAREAARQHLADVALVLNGEMWRQGIRASRPTKFRIPADRLRPGLNVLELRSRSSGAFHSVRLWNYDSLNRWFPFVAVIHHRGPYHRPVDAAGLAVAGAVLGVGVLIFWVLWRWSAGGLQVPLWTGRQWQVTVLAAAGAIGALSVWNVAGATKVLIGQWSAAVLLAGWFAASAAVCAWRNLVARRWETLEEASRQRWLQRRRVVLLLAGIWLTYNANFRRVGEVDCVPAPLMAMSLIRHGDLDLDEYNEAYLGMPTRAINGHWVSRWTPGSALFCVPFFLVPTWLGLEATSRMVDLLAKLTASTVTAMSAVFVYLALRFFCSARGAVWLTVAYALGTASFSISSQDTWQHGPAQLCLAAALYGIARGGGSGVHAAVGLAMGLSVVCRPTTVLLVIALWAWTLWRHGGRAGVWQVLGGLPPMAFLAAYNLYYFGTPGLGGYKDIPGGGWVAGQMPTAFLGLLISPNRGMFVFSPFLVMIAAGLIPLLRGRTPPGPARPRGLATLFLTAIVAHLVLTSAWKSWHAIASFGSRYTADAMPFWALLGGLMIDQWFQTGSKRRLFVGLVVLSIAIQSLGVFVGLHEWNAMQLEQHRREGDLYGRPTDHQRIAWELDPPQIVWQIGRALGIIAPGRYRGASSSLPAEGGAPVEEDRTGASQPDE